MKPAENKEIKISFWASHFTTIVSVTMVLLLGGIIALTWISGDNETRRLEEQLELTVILGDSIPDSQGERLAAEIGRKPYAATVRFVSRAEAMQLWAEDTGENLQDMFGVNPLSPEVSFTVKADYISKANIDTIKRQLEKVPGVENVASPDDEMVEAMNENLARLTVVLGIVAAVMLFISFVLINNTVHLSIYSRRFTIHTMQLVGATNGFIRRPIVGGSALSGLIAGVIAAGFTALGMWGARSSGLLDIASFISWEAFGIVAACMVAAGVLLCTLCSWIAATRYLRKDYDELFK